MLSDESSLDQTADRASLASHRHQPLPSIQHLPSSYSQDPISSRYAIAEARHPLCEAIGHESEKSRHEQVKTSVPKSHLDYLHVIIPHDSAVIFPVPKVGKSLSLQICMSPALTQLLFSNNGVKSPVSDLDAVGI